MRPAVAVAVLVTGGPLVPALVALTAATVPGPAVLLARISGERAGRYLIGADKSPADNGLDVIVRQHESEVPVLGKLPCDADYECEIAVRSLMHNVAKGEVRSRGSGWTACAGLGRFC